MFEVIVAGMQWDVYDTYFEAIEVVMTLGLGSYVRHYHPATT